MTDLHDRLEGARSSLAFKAPCRVATTANITLSGEQTIDDIAVVEEGANDRPDRVLVKNQTDQTQNGIWTVSTGVWSRARDFDGNSDIVDGTRIYVHSGTVGIGEYTVTSDDPIVIDTSNIVFAVSASNLATTASEAAQAAAEAAQAAAETAETNAETAQTAAEAAQAAAEAASENPAFTYAFDNATADADPGAGEFRLDNATLASVTTIFIDNSDADGNDVSAYFDSFDDIGSSARRGHILVKGIDSADAFFVGLVTGSVVDGTGYRKISVTPLASGGTFTATENFSVVFAPAGADGSGDVVGPASATDGNLASYDGITGKLIQDSGIAAADVVVDADITNMVTASSNLTDGQIVVGSGGGKGVATIPVSSPLPPNDDFDDVTHSGFTRAEDGQANGPATFVAVLTAMRNATRFGQLAFSTVASIPSMWVRQVGSTVTSWAEVYLTGGTDVAVADGGTGRSSHTAYAVLCGGTTTTGAQQSIASVGTSGQVLTSNGAAALPTFQDAGAGGGWEDIENGSGTTVATLDIEIPAAYDLVHIRVFVRPATNNVDLNARFSQDGGSVFLSGAGDYSWATGGQQGNGTEILMGAGGGDAIGSASHKGAWFDLWFEGFGSDGIYKAMTFTGVSIKDDSDEGQQIAGGGVLIDNSNDITDVRFFFTSDDVAAYRYFVEARNFA
jgi:hypothetical protein